MKKSAKTLLLTSLIMLGTAMGALSMTYNEASTQTKPIVVMFHMHGCGACRKFSPIFDKYATKFSNKFNFVKEDIKDSVIGNKLDFPTVPAIFIIEPKTQKATRISDDCAWDKMCFTTTLEKY